MSYQAYQRAQTSAETPSQIEYRLFAQVTNALLDVKDKAVKDVRKMVKTARQSGLDAAIKESESIQEIPREFSQLETMVKKTNKLLTKVIIENIDIDIDQIKLLLKHVKSLNKQSKDFLSIYSDDIEFTSAIKDEPVEETAPLQ